MLADAQQRQEATDPTQSIIVQAPAGSGKTELLTQRYLRLLSTVQTPEQIVALTFTRKAAYEMRARIVLALQQAQSNPIPTSPHQRQTYQYAQAALARDQQLDWQLLQQPHRLKISTIDSLCQTLTQAIPLFEKHLPYAQITQHPKQLYVAAAEACLDHLLTDPTYHPPLECLLTHLDNRQDKLLTLFCDLLGQREQWLPIIYSASQQDKKQYEAALAWIADHELQRFQQTLPEPLFLALMTLSHQMAVIENNPDSPRFALTTWRAQSALNSTITTSLAALLLTSQQTLRQAFDHHVGLKRGVCPDTQYQELKTASRTLFQELAEHPDFLPALLRVKYIPDPSYSTRQWQVLQALFTLLPLLAAHLQVIFQTRNEVDFTAIAQQALEAIGDDDQPTDLALYLDYRIQHLLVDEFQDTSLQQFQLLQQLTQGWQPGDGRTLFVVGDPMQSIYRFRAAEVGLFLRAQHYGIGTQQLKPLYLTCNFRSVPHLVQWINQSFRQIFPIHEDIESGAVSFHAAVATAHHDGENTLLAYCTETPLAEAKILVRCLQERIQLYPEESIAILVRSRHQLKWIIPALQQAGIAYQGNDIDALSHLPHLNDVWAITQALLMPFHRLAWLTLLRSPWGGLTLEDMDTLATTPYESIYEALAHAHELTDLSAEGKLRARYIYHVFHQAYATRARQSLVDWVKQTLSALHLDALLSPSEQQDLAPFWSLLSHFEQNGQLNDLVLFETHFKALYAQQVVSSRINIMTIHKSKGLEFDCVILPGLGRRATQQDKPLIRWLKLPRAQKSALWLVSPVHPMSNQRDSLYDYLDKLDQEKEQYEMQRLFYVAVTRAKNSLILLDHHLNPTQGSFRTLLPQQIFTPVSDNATNDSDQEEMIYPLWERLPLSFYEQISPMKDPHSAVIRWAASSSLDKLIGTITHELLQWMCQHHLQDPQQIPWSLAQRRLCEAGILHAEQTEAMRQMQQQLHAFMLDPIGQWILAQHPHEKNEYALLATHQDELVTRIIDRTFHDQQQCWIIDFKTGQKMLDIQHQQQLNGYARLMQTQTTLPLWCGLYYLQTSEWHTWAYTETITTTPQTASLID